MNKQSKSDPDDLRSFLLLSELEQGEPISQREIAGRLGIALGLVNSYLKGLVEKGFVTVKAYPRNRYAYLLTPGGFSEKSRLAVKHLSNFNKVYRVTRQDSLDLFRHLAQKGFSHVVFCGVDDLTEIFYLSLREAGLQLETIMDSEHAGQRFLDYPIADLHQIAPNIQNPIVLTALQRLNELEDALDKAGIERRQIYGPTLSYAEILSGKKWEARNEL